jgi:hypothetical protein
MSIQPLFIEYLLHKLEVRKMKGFCSEEIEVWQAMQKEFHIPSSIRHHGHADKQSGFYSFF